MLSKVTEIEIKAFADTLSTRTKLLQLAEQGALNAEGMATYLHGLRQLFLGSCGNIAYAAERCTQIGRHELAVYFRDKYSEERGHDQWASADLKALPDDTKPQPAPSVQRLVDYQRVLIEREPALFVVYMLWAEQFTILLGERWLRALATSGFNDVTAISKHLEADVGHVHEGYEILERNAQHVEALVAEVVWTAGDLFIGFCDEVVAASGA